jgi:hypothetical protein
MINGKANPVFNHHHNFIRAKFLRKIKVTWKTKEGIAQAKLRGVYRVKDTYESDEQVLMKHKKSGRKL